MNKPLHPTPPRRFWMEMLRLVRFNNLLIVVLAQILTALFLVSPYPKPSDILSDIFFLLLILGTLSITAAGYIINDYYDIKIDLINKPDRVIIGKILKRRVALVLHAVLNFIGVAIGFSISYTVGLIHLFATFSLWLYSNQLKRLPFIGNLMVAVLTGASIAVVGLYFDKNLYLVNTYAFFAGGITLIRELIKDMEDTKGDARHGCLTLPILWGFRKTKKFIYGLSALFVLSLLYMAYELNNPILLYYFLLLSPVFGVFIYKLYFADTTKAYRYLSNYCKFIMVSGILSMVFFGLNG